MAIMLFLIIVYHISVKFWVNDIVNYFIKQPDSILDGKSILINALIFTYLELFIYIFHEKQQKQLHNLRPSSSSINLIFSIYFLYCPMWQKYGIKIIHTNLGIKKNGHLNNSHNPENQYQFEVCLSLLVWGWVGAASQLSHQTREYGFLALPQAIAPLLPSKNMNRWIWIFMARFLPRVTIF